MLTTSSGSASVQSKGLPEFTANKIASHGSLLKLPGEKACWSCLVRRIAGAALFEGLLQLPRTEAYCSRLIRRLAGVALCEGLLELPRTEAY